MDFAEKVLQLKQDFDDVYEAGKAQGGGGDVIDLARYAKVFQMGSVEGLPEAITFNFDYMTSFTDFWRAVVNTTVKRVTLNINTKPTALVRLFSQNNVGDYNRAVEHITLNADTSSVTNFTQMLYSMSKLKIVDGSEIDFSSATSVNMWCDASVLEEIRVAKETIKISMSINAPALSVDSKDSIFEGLARVETAQTLTLPQKLKVLQSQVDSANAKGWTVAGGTVVSEEEYYA